MPSLTTNQRELLKILLASDDALAAAHLGELVGLSARQVRYQLKGARAWLSEHHVRLENRRGVGYRLDYDTSASRQSLRTELRRRRAYRLALTAGQRQQLLALELLLVGEPRISFQLQREVQVSRTTLLSDLDALGCWFDRFHLELMRRPNFGCQLIGPELMRRQALACLLWGASDLDEPLVHGSHEHGLSFALADDASLSPIVGRAHAFVQECDIQRARALVTVAEQRLGAHYTDEAVLLLSLALAIQTQRVAAGQVIEPDSDLLRWLERQPVWPVAVGLGEQLWPDPVDDLPLGEVGAIALHLLAGERDDRQVPYPEGESDFASLIAAMRSHIAQAYEVPALEQDESLRQALGAHVIPGVLRERYHLWAPTVIHGEMQSDRFIFERMLAQQLATLVAAHTGVILPDAELSNLILLLRAAFLRERPTRAQLILVICPSGMATSQLLLARLQARFPRLGRYEVLSLRDLTTDKINSADLIISPLQPPLPADASIDVIVVHPLLAAEDIETIFRWAQR